MKITSRGPVTLATTFVSAHQIGDIVTFNPFALMASVTAGCCSVKALVMKVSFESGKVLYDLAIEDDTITLGTIGFYEVYPLCNVDSIFVT